MKQALFLLIFPVIAFSQDKIKKVNGQYEILIHVKNGMEKADTTTAIIDAEIVELAKSNSVGRMFSETPITDMFLAANSVAKSSLNEETSYELFHGGETGPIMILKSDKTISIKWEFLGQNSYGLKKWAVLTLDFDLKGKAIAENVQSKDQ